jgi:hypothetical protein
MRDLNKGILVQFIAARSLAARHYYKQPGSNEVSHNYLISFSRLHYGLGSYTLFGDAHLIATMALIHRSTERKRLM